MRWITILGWIVAPYIMIFVKWRNMKPWLRGLGTLWSFIIFANTIYLIRGFPNSDSPNPVSLNTSVNQASNSITQTVKENSTSTASSLHSKTNTTSPNSESSKHVDVGSFGKVGSLDIRVNSVQEAKSVGYASLGETASGAYWIINITVVNDGSSPLGVADDMFYLRDLNGKTYDPDTPAEIYANANGNSLPSTLNPGVSMTTNLVFDMPDFATSRHIGMNYNLVASYGLFGSKETVFNLP